jgi:hypothetical protein
MRTNLHTILPLLTFTGALVASCGKPAPAEPEPQDTRHLRFATDKIDVDWRETGFSVQVDANFDYRVDIQEDWVESDPGKTSTSAIQYFIARKNEAAAERTAVLRFVDKADRYYAKDVKVTQAANPVEKVSLTIVDKDATPETKALFANLWAVAEKGWMFGHHDDLWYGRYWYNEPGGSDTKAVCGDYPGVFSVDFAEIMDNRYASEANAIRRRVILEARERGEVILACMHLNNPRTGGDSWDNSSDKVVGEILTNGTATRNRYIEWLDRCADFALNLKDARGNLIPVILRPYHEHTQGWSWWGSSCTTASEFVALWQFTIGYLRDTRGVHNFLYAISPQMDEDYQGDTRGRLLFRWPGDDWVDFIGMDCYHGTNNKAFESNLKALEALSQEKRKPCGVTEDGKESFTEDNFWSLYLVGPLGAKRISMVTMWRNKYVGNNESDKHYYSVYPGHPSEADFRKMYDDPRSLFSGDLPDMYTLPEGYEIK